LTQLAEDLLLIARSDQGRLPVRRERVSARAVLEDVSARFAGTAQERGRRIVLAGREDASIDADPARLEQALGNLVDNAVRHGGRGVSLRAGRRNGSVELHVLDRGAGFPAAFIERAFERFSRADEGRGGESAGLGLSIVETIARAHGGSAHAANRAGGGADVWIELPASRKG
jgi:signal transduction histidine kinase